MSGNAAAAVPFQSTLSMRRATVSSLIVRGQVGISIHALHEESDFLQRVADRDTPISIHALHEESDSMRGPRSSRAKISIHALHEESDRSKHDG